MEKTKLVEYVTDMTDTLKKEMPKSGMSFMITADGQGSVVCHAIGNPGRIIEVLAKTASANDKIMNMLMLAVTGAELIKEIKEGVSAKVVVEDFSEEYADDKK